MFDFPFDESRRPQIMVIGAHSDDIEIGCGGTLLRLVAERPDANISWVVLGGCGPRGDEARASAAAFLRGTTAPSVEVKGFRDSFFPQESGRIKEFFESLKRSNAPDLVLTHFREDAHQDHRVVSELTWNTFRESPILEYEIPKYDGDLGRPNLFVTLSKAVCAAKIELLLEHFATQRDRYWFTDDTFWAMLRLRGVEARSPSRFAEAFHCRKLVF